MEKVQKLEPTAMQGAMAMTTAEYLERRKAVLAITVAQRIRDAKGARTMSGIEDIWRDDEDQYNGIDEMTISWQRLKDPTTSAQINPDGRSRVFLNITEPKSDAAIARVAEMLVPNDEKPWEMKPTPIPELDEMADDQGAMGEMVQLGDGNEVPAPLVAKVLLDKASKKAENMATQIEDWFVEGEVYSHMRRVIRDAGRIGSGVLKGPVPVTRKRRKWKIVEGVAMMTEVAKTVPTSKAVSAWNLFPDPSCGEDIHKGSFIVERDYLTARQLRDLANIRNMEGEYEYDRAAIAQALREGPPSKPRDQSNGPLNLPGDMINDSEVFEVYYYYGDCLYEDMIAMGVSGSTLPGASSGGAHVEGQDDDDIVLTAVPAIVTMLNDRPIKAAVNPLETGEFPYDVFTWKPVAGQVWGRGVPHRMAVAQRGVNAALRRMMENAGLAAGPQIAFMKNMLKPVNGRYEVVGPKLWECTPKDGMDDIRKAFAVFNIDSSQQQLQAIIDFFLKMADELTNLPMLLQGMQGSAPDLLGGMKMLENNANAPLRVIAKQYDDQLIVRHLNRYNDWGMQDPNVDPKCKGDSNVKARGSTALVAREIAREFLMMLFPVADDPKLDINKSKLTAEMARANGYDITGIQYTKEEKDKLAQDAAANPAPADPRIAAQQLRNEGLEKQMVARAEEAERERVFKERMAEAERILETTLADIDKEIQMMKLAGDKSISLESIRAALAGKAMDLRNKREEMSLKLAPQNTSGTGI